GCALDARPRERLRARPPAPPPPPPEGRRLPSPRSSPLAGVRRAGLSGRRRAPRRGDRRHPRIAKPRSRGGCPGRSRRHRLALQRMAEIEVQQADITKLDVDAIANAANTDLRHGGGVAGAIVRAGGREVQDESDEVAPIGLGEAVATSAGELPARWVIHAATMHLGGPTSAEVIRA